MLTTESGNPIHGDACVPGSCRDKGRGGVDEGALCLSWLGCDLFAPRSHQDKHKAQYISNKTKGEEDKERSFLTYYNYHLQNVGEQKGSSHYVQSTLPGPKRQDEPAGTAQDV